MEEFKITAVNQVIDHGYPAIEVAGRLGVSIHSIYVWTKRYSVPEAERKAKGDKRLIAHIQQSWLESGAVYGYRKVSDDLRELGERYGINRVHRIMRSASLRSQTGYGKHEWKGGSAPSVVAPNHLQRHFDALEPNRAWVTDINYIRTHEGWLYLAVVLDLFSR